MTGRYCVAHLQTLCGCKKDVTIQFPPPDMLSVLKAIPVDSRPIDQPVLAPIRVFKLIRFLYPDAWYMEDHDVDR